MCACLWTERENVLICRLCAAAFVQNRKSYTGCTDAPNPTGESGRAWCYVEAQVCSRLLYDQFARSFHDLCSFCKLLDSDAGEAAWNYCGPQLHAFFDSNSSCMRMVLAAPGFSISASYPTPSPPSLLCEFTSCNACSVRLRRSPERDCRSV